MNENEVVIDTELDTSGIDKGCKGVKAKLDSLAQSINQLGNAGVKAFQKQVNAIAKQTQAVSAQKAKVDELKAKYEELSNTGVKTKAFTDMEKEAEKLKTKILNLVVKMDEFKQAGGNTDTKGFQKMESQLQAFKNQLEGTLAVMEEMKTDNEAYEGADTSKIEAQYEQAREKLQALKNELTDSMRNLVIDVDFAVNSEELEDLENREISANNSTIRFTDALKEAQNIAKKFASVVKTVAGGFASYTRAITKHIPILNRLVSAQKKTNSAFSGGLKNILKYAVGIRSLFVLFNKLRSALTDGIKNMAQWNNGSNSVNKNLSSLMSALTQLKNSFASAFAPILNYIVPALVSLCNAISQAVTYIGMMIASISGSKTFIKATAVQQDYANSLDNTASSAKSATKALAKFDELNVLNSDNNDSGSGSGSTIDPNEMFEEVELADSLVLDASELGDKIAKSISDALSSIKWEDIKSQAQNIGEKIAEFLNQFWENKKLAYELGNAIAQSLNTAVNFVYGLVSTTNWSDLGMWLGTLVSTGVARFDWSKAGDTISTLINGFADAVSGFCTTFEGETLGTGISNLINHSLGKIDVNKLGNATASVINEAFGLVASLLEGLDSGRLGAQLANYLNVTVRNIDWELVGNALAMIVNEAFDFLYSFFTETDFFALGENLTNGFITAVKEIDWQLIADTFVACFTDMCDFADGIASAVNEQLNEAFSSIGIDLNLSTDPDELRGLWLPDTSGFEEANELLKEIKQNQDAVKQGAEELSQTTETTYSGINTNLDTTKGKIDNIKYAVDTTIPATTAQFDVLNDKTQGMAKTTETAVNTATSSYSKLETATSNASTNTGTSLTNIKDKNEEVGNSFGTLSDTVSSNLETLSTTIDTWYQENIEARFSEEKWTELGTTMVTSMTESLTLFMETWTEMFEEWNASNDELYFGSDAWSLRWQVITDTYTKQWETFSKLWNTNMTTWWTTYVEPFFTVERWQTLGTNMCDGVTEGFKSIVGSVGGVLNNMISVFDKAFDKLEDAMNDLIKDYNKNASIMGESTLSTVSYSKMGKISIPALASGAVIPANNKFLAILGDQKSGTNIEAPLSTIEDALRNVLNEDNSTSMSQALYYLQIIAEKELSIDSDEMFSKIRHKATEYKRTTGNLAFD